MCKIHYTYQYNTTSPLSTSKRKCEKPRYLSLHDAIKYQDVSSVNSACFSSAFQPQLACWYILFMFLSMISKIQARHSGSASLALMQQSSTIRSSLVVYSRNFCNFSKGSVKEFASLINRCCAAAFSAKSCRLVFLAFFCRKKDKRRAAKSH